MTSQYSSWAPHCSEDGPPARRRCRYPFRNRAQVRPSRRNHRTRCPFLPRDRRPSRATGAPIVRSSSDRRSGWTCIGDSIRVAGGHESRAADRSAHHRPGHNGVVYHSKSLTSFEICRSGNVSHSNWTRPNARSVCWRKSVRNCPPQALGNHLLIEMPKCPCVVLTRDFTSGARTTTVLQLSTIPARGTCPFPLLPTDTGSHQSVVPSPTMNAPHQSSWLTGSEMGERIRAFDWSQLHSVRSNNGLPHSSQP